MTDGATIVVVLRDDLAVVTRVLGVFRRRGMALAHLEVTHGPEAGVATLAARVRTDAAALERSAGFVRKIVGVQSLTLSPEGVALMPAPRVRVFYDRDADPHRLDGRTVAVIGYGSQGHAHARNLHDRGLDVVVGLRPTGHSWSRAQEDGLRVAPVREAAAAADVIMLLVPDQEQRALYEADVAPGLEPGKTLMFAHGFNVHYREIAPPAGVDVSMVAPKSPGRLVRSEFANERGVPALVAVHQDGSGHALADALAYAWAIGCTRAGVIETSFREETETDLFGEQAVLCGGVTALIKAGFETLVGAGYAPEMAYFECLHELKLIVDLIYRGGLDYMRRSVSDTAEYGDYTRGPRIVTPEVRAEMCRILGEVQDGSFAREWIAETRAGGPAFATLRTRDRGHRIEEVGARLRAMMPWLEDARAGQPA